MSEAPPEPKGELLWLRQVLKWQPSLTRRELYDWEELDLMKVFRKTKRSQRRYYKSEIKRMLKIK